MKVRFLSSWFAPTEKVDAKIKGRSPLWTISGRFFRKYNENDPRTVYDLPEDMLPILPKSAVIMDDKEAEEKLELIRKARSMPEPENLHDIVKKSVGVTDSERLAEIEAQANETLKKRQAAAKKARETLAKKRAAEKKAQAASQ